MHARTTAMVVALAFAACASSLPIERREYILSRPHGWIELEVEDVAIPMVPFDDEKPNELMRPEYCNVGVRLDREPFIEGYVYPDGEAAPFRIRSGFRFPVPVGTISLSVTYGGCDVAEGRIVPVELAVEVPIAESLVTDLAFDGATLAVGTPRADDAVTLERIYDAVRGGR
jgi:hypothetical protein